MVGKGSNFYYHFYTGTHNGLPADTGDFDNGTQFNLFGNGASLAQSPTPPVRQFDPAPTRKTTSVHYHNDVTHAKK